MNQIKLTVIMLNLNGSYWSIINQFIWTHLKLFKPVNDCAFFLDRNR